MLKPKSQPLAPDLTIPAIDTVDNELAEAVAAAVAKHQAGEPADSEMQVLQNVSRRRKQFLKQRTRAFA